MYKHLPTKKVRVDNLGVPGWGRGAMVIVGVIRTCLLGGAKGMTAEAERQEVFGEEFSHQVQLQCAAFA
jgi:hypothetical protein